MPQWHPGYGGDWRESLRRDSYSSISMASSPSYTAERDMLNEILADTSVQCSHPEGDECALCRARASKAADALRPTSGAPDIGAVGLAVGAAVAGAALYLQKGK
jgi:hypothetical protein